MEEIIRYFAEVFIKNMEELWIKSIREGMDLSDLVTATRKETDEIGRRFILSVLQDTEKVIKDLPIRKRKWSVERYDTRKLLTSLGIIIFTRALYVSKDEKTEDGKEIYAYLLDNLFNIPPNQEMTEDVMASIYEEAVETSYRKAGDEATDYEGVSKQTVKNLLHKTKFPNNFQIPEQKKEVEYLYVDADEDHYHLQFRENKGDLEINEYGRKNNGAISKIIYVFEGIKPETPRSKRNKLINKHYFCRGTDQDNKDLWKEVFEYIDATYDMSKIKRLYINADGGSWIKSGYRGLADVTFVLDEFHITKYVNKITRHMKDSIDDAKSEIYECIRNKRKSDFLEIVERLVGCTESEKVQNFIRENANYIASNWTAAKYRMSKKENVVACTAEGHVYHALSCRMSTPALGWSLHGGCQMAHLREYYLNGGDMLELAKYQREEIPMAAGAEEVVLSAYEILLSEKTNRTKEESEYGKYSELIHSSFSKQTSQKLYFTVHGKLF